MPGPVSHVRPRLAGEGEGRGQNFQGQPGPIPPKRAARPSASRPRACRPSDPTPPLAQPATTTAGPQTVFRKQLCTESTSIRMSFCKREVPWVVIHACLGLRMSAASRIQRHAPPPVGCGRKPGEGPRLVCNGLPCAHRATVTAGVCPRGVGG